MSARMTEIFLVRSWIAYFKLGDGRLLLVAVWGQLAAFLENTSRAITRDSPVILDGVSRAVSRADGPDGGHCRGEWSIQKRRDGNAHESRCCAALAASHLLGVLGGGGQSVQSEKTEEQSEEADGFHSAPSTETSGLSQISAGPARGMRTRAILLHEFADDERNFIGRGIQREMSTIYNVYFGFRHLAAIGFRLGWIERRLILAPYHQQTPAASRASRHPTWDNSAPPIVSMTFFRK